MIKGLQPFNSSIDKLLKENELLINASKSEVI